MKKSACLLLLVVNLVGCAAATIAAGTDSLTNSSETEKTIWELEHSYWRYVEANDLANYIKLWHPDFLGWPYVSATPVGKDHITDWITSQTSKGLTFKAGEFKPAAVHVTGNVAMAYYRITLRWLGKDGNGQSDTVRITHTWLKTGDDWQIIGGMSMQQADSPAK